jgi:MinD-like ATPase involved in chromosome partitioning or flagellar assembly
MKFLYFSLKGGVGKSSIALNHALENNYSYITNDITTNMDRTLIKSFHQIPHSMKRIPKDLLYLEDVVFDFGAMSSVIDSKVTHAVKHCDCVIIPTLTDARSLKATIETYLLIKDEAKSVIIIINNYQQASKYEYAYDKLTNALGKQTILDIRSTTLFERVARDGIKWFKNIGHAKGEHQLLKTKNIHQEVYKTINKIAKKGIKWSK